MRADPARVDPVVLAGLCFGGKVRTIQDKPALRDVGLRVLENSEGCVEWKDSFTRHHF